jgi:hypothetical protein
MTEQVQAWMAGRGRNFGILLKHEPLAAPRTLCFSREAEADQPYLELRYSSEDGESSAEQPPAADTSIWESMPSYNFGTIPELHIGWPIADAGTELQSLIRFATPVPPVDDPGCTLGIGYWRTHAGPESGGRPDEVTELLPLWLGDEAGEHSILGEQAATARDLLTFATTDDDINGIVRLRAPCWPAS